MNGEIVVAPYVCEDLDCQCDRVQQGIISHGYSTEVEVSDSDISTAALLDACLAHLEFSQWAAVVGHPSELELLAADLVNDMKDVAGRFPLGTLLRVRFERGPAKWQFVGR